MRGKLALLGCLPLVLWSCHRQPERLPLSTGATCEVWVADSGDVLRNLLEQPYSGLPQDEPSYDVRTLPADKESETCRHARNIVIYDAATPLQIARNRHARPQLVIRTNGQQPDRLRRLLAAQETAWQMARLKARHNPAAERKAHDLFGIRILLPEDLTSSKTGRDFLWLSNNSPDVMRNLCLFRLPDTASWEASTDSVLRVNLPGETDAMHMRLVGSSIRQEPQGADGNLYAEGLWEMTGDAMGGAFAMRMHPCGHGYLATLVFVYAPGARKRDPMMALKAILHTTDYNH